MHTQSALSTEYVRVAIGTSAAADPTSDNIQMAFPVSGVDPVSGDWKAASWETDASTSPPTYYARCLVGPTGGVIALTEGLYDTYIKVLDNPESVIKNTGALAIL